MIKINELIVKTSVVLTLIFLIVSCATNKSTNNTKRELIFFPAPPDTAKIQFLTVINNSNDITGEQSSFDKFTKKKENKSGIIKPFGISVIKNKIFVVDSKRAGIDIIDLQKTTFEFKNPTGLGNLKTPLNCFADTSGNLFVTDMTRKEIVVFDYDMNFKASFGIKIIEKPGDLCAYKDKIYVTDTKNMKIFVFSKSDYKLVTSFPDVSEKDSAFLHQPNHISIRNDIIYVTDFGEFVIKKYDLNGKFLGTVGSYGDSPGQFTRPKGLTVDRNDFLYVLDSRYNNVQIFNRLGQLMLFFGGDKAGHGFLNMPIKITIDYDNLDYFREYVDSKYDLKYLIFITNQFGDDRVTVYGFVELK